ncbi:MULTISPECIES: amino acid permease [Sphingomonadales]|uniref:Amino acid permease n=2 Tax=Edaphosphingomonas TaxID=3423724 RepID=A0A2T4I6A3_9SPHN|nr:MULTISPECIES: amino acid permease [Sphingomonas]AGH48381.1 amino acid permease-associated protein [Sphingomonas sp. MM-1]MDX3883566.1 amino acid permease [Sphingomonas sp.]OHT20854.1 putative amino acid permease YhdG [Sphingomonas haloaromaticamans]PTD26127.1 amino acid permease [Sphingomonas fennica]
MGLFDRRKPLEEAADPSGERLAPTLSWPHLVALGVGAIVGTGILTLIGVGADRAGPAVLLSFAIAGAICACAALAYAEMATMMPAAGSAYSYSYTVLGEIIAWVVGWSLILEYSLVVSTVAVGWSGYAAPLLHASTGFPMALMQGPELGGIVNLPAIFIIAVVAGLLIVGTRESATLNAILVLVKIATLTLFVAVALPYFDTANLHPFMPFGFAKGVSPDGVERGVMAAAAIIFFAFYGFDAISTAAEETKKPERDLPIGIIGSMLACTLIYVLVAAAAVGALPFTRFADSPEPLALILREIGQGKVATVVAAAAVIALPTVLLAFLFGQSRIFLVMARDGFLPKPLAHLSKRGAPVRITLITAAFVSVIAGFVPLDKIAALANSGTLVAFIAVSVCMLVMRRRAPDARRPFRTPAATLVGAGAIIGCLYLFLSLPTQTQVWFFLWNGFGLVVYFLYGRARSLIGRGLQGR